MVHHRAINLTFHGVGPAPRALDDGEAGVWISRDRFLGLLDEITGRDDVLVSFDDGNASDLEIALPALQERHLHATFFVVAGRIGQPGFLDPAGVRELAAAGMDIGCHGMRHRPWRGLGDQDLREELIDAKAALENLVGRPVTTAACPFGSYDRHVLESTRRAGYRRVYTSDRGTARPDDFLQARNSVRRGDEPGLLGRISALDRRPAHGLVRRTKAVAKRWR